MICPKCQRPLGKGVTRCWNAPCDYVIPRAVPPTSRLRLETIGYWKSSEEVDWHCPDPRSLVKPGWLAKERDKLLGYLGSGIIAASYWGRDWCRFQCGVTDQEIGSTTLTDGTWAWPFGLAHYVDRHDVILPEEFIEHCMSRSWRISLATLPDLGPRMQIDFNLDFWTSWARGLK